MARQVIYEGKKFSVVREDYRLSDGRTVQKEIIQHPGASVMIPFVDTDHICMIRNERAAARQTLLELPAGTLDPGETPEATARRELEEETGYRAGRLRKVTEFYPAPGFLSELLHLFVAEELTPGTLHLDLGENLHPTIIAWKEAMQLALDGTIKDAKTLVGLLLWDRLRPR